MNKDDYERLLEDTYCKIVEYEERFSRDLYEIAVLMPKVTADLFVKYNGFQRYVQYDLHETSMYLFGHKVIFVNEDFIRSHNGDPEPLHLVIGCKERDTFPMQANAGDYVFHNGDLFQIKNEFFVDGQRGFETKIVDFEYTDIIFDTGLNIRKKYRRKMWHEALLEIQERNQKKEAWIEQVDHNEINTYLLSLPIV